MNKPYIFNQLIQFILKDFFDKLVKKNYWCLIKKLLLSDKNQKEK